MRSVALLLFLIFRRDCLAQIESTTVANVSLDVSRQKTRCTVAPAKFEFVGNLWDLSQDSNCADVFASLRQIENVFNICSNCGGLPSTADLIFLGATVTPGFFAQFDECLQQNATSVEKKQTINVEFFC